LPAATTGGRALALVVRRLTLMVTLAFVVFLVVHGLIHVLGFVKAFGYADLPALTLPIAPAVGVLWQVAACLFLAAALAVYACPRVWWLLGGLALVVSMVAIVPSWRDAKIGAAANGLVLIGVVFGALTYGPTSLRAAYDRDVDAALSTATRDRSSVVTDADLAGLPLPVQRYLRASGVVGQPRVVDMQVRIHGRIRSAPDAVWMPFTAEQHNTFGRTPARLFYMTATRAMVPVQGYHRFAGTPASMRIRAAAVVPLVDVSGDQMTRSETVTLFNDICVMAPAALLDSGVRWLPAIAAPGDATDHDTVRAQFAHLGHTVSADLVIDADGALVDFVSDDRFAASPDGTTMTRQRWSTPLRGVRGFGRVRLAGAGEARWHDGDRSWSYIELTIDEVRYNVGRWSR
jgi:hypothetical protein